MMSDSVLVFNPAASYDTRSFAPKVVADLHGTTVGFLDNTKPNFSYLAEALGHTLAQRYGIARFLVRRKRYATVPAPAALISELCEQCDVVVTGSGD